MEIQERPHTWLDRLGRRLGMPRYLPEKTIVRCDDFGLTVTESFRKGPPRVIRAKWNEIDGAVAFKLDCFTVDQICLAFTAPDGAFVTTENMNGWQKLIEEVPTYLHGMPLWGEWLPKVMHPPWRRVGHRCFQGRSHAIEHQTHDGVNRCSVTLE